MDDYIYIYIYTLNGYRELTSSEKLWVAQVATVTFFTRLLHQTWVLNIYIVIHRLTVLLYHYSSVWLETQDTAVWMQYMDANETDGEKTWRHLHKNAANNIEQVFEATPHKAAAILITKTIKVRRTRHAGHCWRIRDVLISDVLLWTPSDGRAESRRPAYTYIQ